MPKNNLLWYLLMVFFLFIRTNKLCYGIMIGLGSSFAWTLDPLFDKIGYAVLTFQPLENTFAKLLDIPFVGFTKFNNTIVAGSLCFSLALYLPLFAVVVLFFILWRKILAPKFAGSKFVALMYKFPLINKIISKFAQ